MKRLLAVSLLFAACSSDDGTSNASSDIGVPDLASADASDTGGDLGGPDSGAVDEDLGDTNDVRPDQGAIATGWSTRAELGEGARQETVVLALDQKIWVIGGYDERLQMSALNEVYDPQTDTWSRAADFPVRAHHMNAVVYDQKIWVTGFLVGGFAADGRSFVYDPQSDAWSPGPDLPSGRERGSSATGVIDGKIYVAGGLRGGAVADFDVLDPDGGVWTALPDVPRTVDHMGFGVVDGTLVVASGRDGSIGSVSGDVDLFDPDVGSWRSGAPILTPRGGVASAVLDGNLYVIGGEGNDDDPSGVFPQVERYDLGADAWETMPALPTPVHGVYAAALDGVIYVPGGATRQAFAAVDVHQVFVP